MTHNDVFTSVRSFHSGEMGEWENVKDVGSLAVNIKHKADRPIAVLYHKKINWLLFSFTGCKSQFMFHSICVSELLGSAKKVNVNFQDTDG